MKANCSNILLSLFLLSALVGCANVSPDWVRYKLDVDGNVYSYDKGYIADNDIIKVWVEETYSIKGKKNEIQLRKKYGLSIKGHEKLSHKQIFYEINCKEQKIRILSQNDYDADGKLLYAGEDNRKWSYINHDTMGDILQKEVCRNM